MEKTLKSSAISHGLYLGLIMASMTILAYALYLDLFTKWWYGIFLLLLIIVVGIVSSMKARKLSGGFINFKGAFSAYFIAVAVGIIISTVVSIIIFNVVDPEAATTIQERVIEIQMEMMEKFGAPQESIDEAMRQAEANGNMFSIGNTLKSLAFQLVGYSIVGLIVALVVKKNDPEAA